MADPASDDITPANARRRRTFRLSARVLAAPAYRRLWVSGIIYNSARWVEIITSGWIILEITGSPFLLGLSGFSRVLPMLLLGAFFGVIADRYRRIDILVGVHVVGLAVGLLLTGAFLLGTPPVWAMYLLIVCLGCGSAADFSARSALIGEVQERALLGNAMSLESLSMNAAKISAAIGAGALLSAGGAQLGYACLAGLHGCGLLWLLALRRRLPPPSERPHAAPLRIITSLYTGWTAALQIPVVRGVFIVTIIMNVLIFPYQQLIAIVASDILLVGPFWMGVLAGADGIGAALTSARLAFGPSARRPGLLFLGGSVACAALLIVLALSPIFALSLLVQLVLGVCSGLFGAHQSALVLSATPTDARARALGLIATAIGMTPLGMLLIGGLSSTTGAQTAIAAMGALGLLGLVVVCIANAPLRTARIA